jgi:tetratricopeptide (TPR) repeat protein
MYTPHHTEKNIALVIKPDDKKALYTVGYTLYQDEQYAKALSFFATLSFYEPANATYYALQAACHKMLKEYDQAIHYYSLAFLLQPGKAEYGLYVAECQIAAGYIHPAIKTLITLLGLKTQTVAQDNTMKTAQFWLALLQSEI